MNQINFKYLSYLTLLYMTIKLLTVVLIYKILFIHKIIASASTLVIPFWFILGDIIAEVYGYKIAKQLIYGSIICQFIFAIAAAFLIKWPSPPFWQHQEAYTQVLGSLPRVACASFLAIIIGALSNAYFISKWKMRFQGKYFWLRSCGASSIGELIFTIIAYFSEFLGTMSFSNVLRLVCISYIIKLIVNPILGIPSLFLVSILKKLECLDSYQSLVTNPFENTLKKSKEFHQAREQT